MSTEEIQPANPATRRPTALVTAEAVRAEAFRVLQARLGEAAAADPAARERILSAAQAISDAYDVGLRGDQASAWKGLTAYDLSKATAQVFMLGLSPAEPIRQIYLFPQGGQIQVRISPAGIVELAARCGQRVIMAVVREGDVFEYEEGAAARLTWRPRPFSTAPIIGAFAACYRAADGGLHAVAMLSREQLMVRKGAAKNKTVWERYEPEMMAKSALHSLLRAGGVSLRDPDGRLENALLGVGIVANEHDEPEVFDNDEPRTRILQPPPAPALAAPPPTIERTRPAAPPMYTADGDDGESYADPPSNG